MNEANIALSQKAMELLADFDEQYRQALISVQKKEAKLFEIIDYTKLVEFLFCVQTEYTDIEELFDELNFNKSGEILIALQEEMGKLISQ